MNVLKGDWQFIAGAHNLAQIPQYQRNPEIAFCGASNVGKSSLINALVDKKIAITSATPGCTQQINFYCANKESSKSLIVIDFPGHGYAKVGKKIKQHWQYTSYEFLTQRCNLKRVFFLIDPIKLQNKDLKDDDLNLANTLSRFGISFQIVFTKTDKLSPQEIAVAENKILEKAAILPTLHPSILKVNTRYKDGISTLRNEVINLLS